MEGKEMKEGEQKAVIDGSLELSLDTIKTTRGQSQSSWVELSELVEDMASNAVLKPLRFLPSGDSHLPWLFAAGSLSSTARTFINISNKTSYVLDVPFFYHARLLHSKKGWLLFHSEFETWMPHCFFLFNPFTGEKMDLPLMDEIPLGPAVFSTTSSSSPHLVVVVSRKSCGINVACPGQREWRKHIHWGLATTTFDLVIVGDKVVCFVEDGSLMVLDVQSGGWCCFRASIDGGTFQKEEGGSEAFSLGWEPLRLVSHLSFDFPEGLRLGVGRGYLFRLTSPKAMARPSASALGARGRPKSCRRALGVRQSSTWCLDKNHAQLTNRVSRVVGVAVEDLEEGIERKPLRLLCQNPRQLKNFGEALLMKMDELEFEDRDWFLGTPGPCCYTAKGGGNKVYRLRQYVTCHDKAKQKVKFGVTVQDLAEGSASELLPSHITGMSEVRWVDLRFAS